MTTPNGQWAERLNAALRDAFSLPEFTQLLRNAVGQRIDDVTLAPNFEARVFETIETARRRGWLLQLVSAACDARTRNPDLHELAAQAGLTAAPSGLERLIRAAAPLLDFPVWRARLGELEGQVCRVEIPAGTASGTGFLVGPDLVLTSYHVVAALAEGHGDPRAARLRFDYKRAPDGTEIYPGHAVKLAADWLVAGQPWSPLDGQADHGDLLPAPHELDFALLRVAGSPGEQPVGLAEALPEAPRRGWIRSSQIGSDGLDADSLLFLLQHPVGAPLKVSFGPSQGLNANKSGCATGSAPSQARPARRASTPGWSWSHCTTRATTRPPRPGTTRPFRSPPSGTASPATRCRPSCSPSPEYGRIQRGPGPAAQRGNPRCVHRR